MSEQSSHQPDQGQSFLQYYYQEQPQLVMPEQQVQDESLAFRAGRAIGRLLSRRSVAFEHIPEGDQGPWNTGFEADTTAQEAVTENNPQMEFFNTYASDEVRTQRLNAINEELKDSDMQHVVKLVERKNILFKRLKEESMNGSLGVNTTDERIKQLENTLQTMFKDTYGRYKEIARFKEKIEKDSNLYTGEEAVAITQRLLDTDRVFHQNKAGGFFIDEERLNNKTVDPNKIIQLDARDQEVVQIPLDSFVSIAGAHDWEGRSSLSHNGAMSRTKIADYASRETPFPPVDDLFCFVLPDGRTIFESANAHRVAAAIKRGDTHIGFKGVMHVSALPFIPGEIKRQDMQNGQASQ